MVVHSSNHKGVVDVAHEIPKTSLDDHGVVLAKAVGKNKPKKLSDLPETLSNCYRCLMEFSN